MTVQETSRIDMIAQAPDGRLVVVMTEDRLYAGGDEAAMVEDLRQKLNTAVHAIRSGELARSTGRVVERNADIELSCMDEPPARVREMIGLAAEGLRDEQVGVRWRVVEPSKDELLEDLRRTLLAAAPKGTERLELTATLVGGGMAGGLTAEAADGKRTALAPSDDLVLLLQLLKGADAGPVDGTWLTLRATVDRDGVHRRVDDDEPPGGAAGFPPRDWAAELERYPRAEVPAWWRAQLPGSGAGPAEHPAGEERVRQAGGARTGAVTAVREPDPGHLSAEEPALPVQPGQPAPQEGGGVVRIVLGIVLIVVVVLGAAGQARTGFDPTGGVAAVLGASVARIAAIAGGVVLIVFGARAARRRAERRIPPR